jgi:pyruvate, orthophosphate dikinase
MKPRFVYSFGNRRADGDRRMRDLLGGKGANLAEMTNLGLPVPAGFTITTEVCHLFLSRAGRYPKGLDKEVAAAMRRVEETMGARFGDGDRPLLVSVRSGAPVSLPGMMDTVLNLGLNERTVEGLARASGNGRFAWDSYRRFVQMYGDVVMGLKPASKEEVDPFEAILHRVKGAKRVAEDTALSEKDLRGLVAAFKEEIARRTGKTFPEDPEEQLWNAIGAVFRSWNNPRAIAYRRLNGIRGDLGTAVNVVAMVYGNLGEDSATGVAFTRDPATGEPVLYGEYLRNAQGEDVVAGTRTPRPIAELRREMPACYAELERIRGILERHYREMQDVEFTIQQGRLWMLQCRTGKRTGFAAVRIAVDMVEEGLVTKEESLARVDPESLNQYLRPVFDVEEKRKAIAAGKLLAKGLNAGPGAASGKVVFHAEDAEAWAGRGETVILARTETSPEDIRGMAAAAGIVTVRGGMTSHAALVGRQMGKVCVVGCGALEIDLPSRTMRAGARAIREGEWISLDGTTGEVIAGKVETRPSEVLEVLLERSRPAGRSETYGRFAKLMRWADAARRLRVRANADQPDQAATAVAFGAEGIGLCRTEHMFFGPGKIGPMREMILAEDAEGRRRALAKLLPLQRADFAGIFRAMGPRPVTVRTLDPPLHEFLPNEPKAIAEVAAEAGITPERVAARARALHEGNPMLGFRGCRLGIVFPEITEMQARALFEAACDVAAEKVAVRPEIMVPLVGTRKEFDLQAEILRRVAEEVFREKGRRVPYLVGTMIEVPRAALAAASIAEAAEFFSFGTNDLTQTAIGLSRDDAGTFLPRYVEAEIYERDPFVSIDRDGVGRLMRIAVEEGTRARPDLKVGICGEHGGDPSSIAFCEELGLAYVSCSPFRLPIARLAAAQAALAGKGRTRRAEAASEAKAARKGRRPKARGRAPRRTGAQRRKEPIPAGT